ncbi:glycosyltransferase [Natronococcus occultus]|uniref:Glycosyl transferase n=1 Tax=Natronococcus occultus SP4 TaxID=694430 RepID=L0JXB6_9EURY|nr:glycosyltransferase [Natronococcus occultus]AGB36935.1 glycosyl transferase [Natronococcus occultus SP4]
MDAPTPIAVILPTTGWNDVCEQIADQLQPDDELLVVCDEFHESVADRAEARDGVRSIVAGEPEDCSGKANAIAAGMEAADAERIVWTDDDFSHPSGWLEKLRIDYDRRGPTSELPVFVGRDPLAAVLEPTHAISGTLAVSLANIPWGGSLVFERDDLDDEQRFLDELRQTVSDDGLLSEHVEFTTIKRPRHVEIGGSTRETLENQARFVKIVRYHDPTGTAAQGMLAAVLTVACLLFPLPMLALTTLSMAAIYAAFGIHRWTFLAAYPVALAAIPLLVYGLARRTFVWGGRRYRWDGKFDVTIEPL